MKKTIGLVIGRASPGVLEMGCLLGLSQTLHGSRRVARTSELLHWVTPKIAYLVINLLPTDYNSSKIYLRKEFKK